MAERHDADGPRTAVREASPTRVDRRGRRREHPSGRILLGWSPRRGVWELPSGKNDADEDFLAAAVRELEEETGLKADPADARLLALLMDSTHSIPRLTADVRVTACSGEPAVTEMDLIRRGQWMEPADLPHIAQELVGPHGAMISIDICPFVTDRARRFLDDTGCQAVRVHLDDGEHAPPTTPCPPPWTA
ncbi:NUDIX domain-containing protein [Streptomyces chartreusis]|uniref:NUDIX domain-containing protein n=1 Tax=Streptomyces chartreusis TaxID=1969 RepID=UPI0021011A45|nr:NUDIX hydrolase [Streptomyces chartreusis]